MIILDYLIPRFCAVCQLKIERNINYNLCNKCFFLLKSPPKKCIFCDTLGQFLCHLCKKHYPKLQNIHITFQYEAPIKQIIQQLKFSLKPYLATTISQIIWQQHKIFFQSLPSKTTIIPMPSGRLRVAKRGYNPVALIAQDRSKLSGLPYDPNYLLKSAFSIPQVELSRQERLYNLQDHFSINYRHNSKAPLESILLIDDVITTGRSFEMALDKLNNPQTKQLFGLFIAQS